MNHPQFVVVISPQKWLGVITNATIAYTLEEAERLMLELTNEEDYARIVEVDYSIRGE